MLFYRCDLLLFRYKFKIGASGFFSSLTLKSNTLQLFHFRRIYLPPYALFVCCPSCCIPL